MERFGETGVVEFGPGDALLVIDAFDDFDHEDGMPLLASFRERGPTMATAIASARESGIPVIYVNDDRDRWDSDASALAREAANGPGGEVIRRLLLKDVLSRLRSMRGSMV